MKILFFGINYSPEIIGIGKYSGEMCEQLAASNNEVDVITALPSYPHNTIHADYKGSIWKKEYMNGVNVYRCPLYVPKQDSAANRILQEVSFIISSLVWWLNVLLKHYDVVICVCPPFHIGIIPLIFSKIKGIPLVCHVQDLQIDAAQELGMINNKPLLRVMLCIEKVILNNCSFVSTITKGMLNKIRRKNIRHNRFLLFPNWVDVKKIVPLPQEASLRNEFNISEQTKTILYSGNLGKKQGLKIIVEAAKKLRHRADICFLVVGTGTMRQKLIDMVAELKLDNVKFFPLQPYEKLSSLLATADIHLVLQKKEVSDVFMPSKLTSIFAAAGFSIVTASNGTSLYDVIENHKLGLVIQPESDALATSIEKALSQNVNDYRVRARKYAEKFISKENILNNFETFLHNIAFDKHSFQPSAKSRKQVFHKVLTTH